MPEPAYRPRVVIVGAGFGGLEAARALSRAPNDVVLIDQRNHHTFQPLLYQVATAALSPAEIAWPVRHMLRGAANTRVVMARAQSVDLERRSVTTTAGEFPYDHLVLASGAGHAYFGHDEWGAHAPGLKSLEDATRIRARFLSSFERAELAQDEAERQRLLTFVIIGAGPTGVEMAGALAEVARDALAKDFRLIDPKAARTLLVEAGPRILPALPEGLSAYARKVLEAIDVKVMTDTRVTGIDARGVDTDQGRIEAATIIWAAGVAASSLVAGLPTEHDRQGRALVGADLSLPGHPEVFVVGDAAALAQDGRPIPGIAPAAKQMGTYVGRLIRARIEGSPTPKPFRYRHEGDLATIGRNAAVVRVRGVTLTGFSAWLFWSVIHIYFLIGLRRRMAVAMDWLWSYLTRQRGARLITGDETSVERSRGF